MSTEYGRAIIVRIQRERERVETIAGTPATRILMGDVPYKAALEFGREAQVSGVYHVETEPIDDADPSDPPKLLQLWGLPIRRVEDPYCVVIDTTPRERWAETEWGA